MYYYSNSNRIKFILRSRIYTIPTKDSSTYNYNAAGLVSTVTNFDLTAGTSSAPIYARKEFYYDTDTNIIATKGYGVPLGSTSGLLPLLRTINYQYNTQPNPYRLNNYQEGILIQDGTGTREDVAYFNKNGFTRAECTYSGSTTNTSNYISTYTSFGSLQAKPLKQIIATAAFGPRNYREIETFYYR